MQPRFGWSAKKRSLPGSPASARRSGERLLFHNGVATFVEAFETNGESPAQAFRVVSGDALSAGMGA